MWTHWTADEPIEQKRLGCSYILEETRFLRGDMRTEFLRILEFHGPTSLLAISMDRHLTRDIPLTRWKIQWFFLRNFGEPTSYWLLRLTLLFFWWNLTFKNIASKSVKTVSKWTRIWKILGDTILLVATSFRKSVLGNFLKPSLWSETCFYACALRKCE